ncbi:hypothetical protein HX92_0223 [Mycobacterium tuberculosis]|nr:hypothetical protein HX92_0223 [Mycobacterium tuberculosis]
MKPTQTIPTTRQRLANGSRIESVDAVGSVNQPASGQALHCAADIGGPTKSAHKMRWWALPTW